MKFTVVKKTEFKKVRGYDDIKRHYVLQGEDGMTFCALNWDLLEKPIVFDEEFNEQILQKVWFYSGTGYAYHRDNKAMHSYVVSMAGLSILDNPNLTVDHINGCKLDNRKKNLRMATQSEQNINRSTRSDKIAPCEELQAARVRELPRYVRWDRTEQKFIIEKHPKLIEEVESGKRKKAVMSGSKSQKITVIEKYQDILARLEKLNNQNESQSAQDFQDFQLLKQKNLEEYNEICKCIQIYEGTYNEESEPVETPPTDLVPIQHTADGKKTVSKLPPHCGINHEDIPKYCYYKPISDKRGDKFVIDDHPALKAQGKRQWSTTEKKSMTTKEKFDILINKYKELENFCTETGNEGTSHETV